MAFHGLKIANCAQLGVAFKDTSWTEILHVKAGSHSRFFHRWAVSPSLTHFQPIFHFYTTWKHRFSDIFRGYRSGTLVENGLIQTQRKTPLNRLIGLLLRSLPYFTGRYSHKQSNLERKLFEFKCIYFRGNKPLDFVQWCEQIHLADIKGCCKLGWKIIFNFNSLERKSQ